MVFCLIVCFFSIGKGLDRGDEFGVEWSVLNCVVEIFVVFLSINL